MKQPRFAFYRRAVISFIASGLVWFTAIGMDLDARGVSLIRLLSFQPLFYFFLAWPFAVMAANSKSPVLRRAAWGTAVLYYLVILVFNGRSIFSGIFHFFKDCDRVIRLMGFDGGILLFTWLVAFSSIQYMIWHPIKIALPNDLVTGASNEK